MIVYKKRHSSECLSFDVRIVALKYHVSSLIGSI